MGWKTAVRATLALSVFALLTGCSGGGDGGNDGPAAPTATGQISGTVSGTTVIAVNDNGDIISRDDTTGKLPDGDGHFPFLLIEIPVGENIRIFLIIEGNIIPLYFDTDGDSLADTNVFALNSAIRIGLGFVGTAVEGEEGRAIPQNNPTDNPDVTGGLVDTSIPASLTEPDTSGLSLSALLTNGFDTLAQGMVLSARAYFREAADVTGSSTSNDADTARFFFTLTRLAALAFDAYSDGTPSDMNRLGDILDRFGCGSSDVQRSNLDAIVLSCTEFLPDNSPTGGDLQDFLYNVVRPELDGAVSDLDNISLSFNTSWVEPFDRQTVESDYGDVLFLRAIIKGILAAIAGQMAYDLEDDIDEAVNNVKTVERLLEDNQELFTIFDTSKL
ncbi:MAG: hypothetical protein OEU26_01025, partial [Candidatus Tectomicrobia bacterium]|nr:hypothetical protein [Candidatus Tectomicrobia bacterium]